MARPKRLYKTKTGRFYYLMKGKRKYLKADVVIPKKGGIVVSTKTRKPKKKATTRKKTAFALNPQMPGLPVHFTTEQKNIIPTEDVVKSEVNAKKKKEQEKEAEKTKIEKNLKKFVSTADSKIKPGSIRFNSKVASNIDKLFEEYASKHGDKDLKTWRKFQNTKTYFSPIEENKEEGFNNSRAPFLYDYQPRYLSSEVPKKTKRDLTQEEKEKDLLSAMSESSGEEARIKERLPGSRRKRKKASKASKTSMASTALTTKEEEEDTDIEGRGPNGLYNSEIEEIMKGLKHGPVPVITSDKIGMLIDYVKPGMKKFGAIINTNPSTSDGSGQDGYRVGHWRSLFFDNDDDGRVSAEYFDPLVENKITPQLKKVMTKIAKKMNPEDYALIKQNKLKRQMDTTNTCGYHSIKFIDDRYNDVPWSEATGYDDYMKKKQTKHIIGDADDSIDGEKDLIGPIKKYDKFI